MTIYIDQTESWEDPALFKLNTSQTACESLLNICAMTFNCPLNLVCVCPPVRAPFSFCVARWDNVYQWNKFSALNLYAGT